MKISENNEKDVDFYTRVGYNIIIYTILQSVMKRGVTMAAFRKHYQDYEELCELLDKNPGDYDREKIERAYRLAEKMHGDQRRVSGVPYILHPTSVACIIVDLGMDTDSVVAALLHDVVEDTPVTLDELKADFGSDVAHLVDGVTKISKIAYTEKEERQAENVRKMLIAMADDIRVIIIKLADRLHNMRTIDCMREQKRRDIALETMEVFAPIAHRLGIKAIKDEMEDLSLQYLDPIGYKEIETYLENNISDGQSFINKIILQIRDRVSQGIDNAIVSGRVKSIHGIYKKLIVQGKSLREIYDIYAVRVIVETVFDCYNVLCIVHDMFQPIPSRFKDYISTPKPNYYRSLHTTVIGRDGVPFEVQIRTREMHMTAEYGIAAHWKYKLGITDKSSMDEQLAWVRKMLANQEDNHDPTRLIKDIKTDLSSDEVFVFTPRGKIINLPLGSTVIDVAYAIHSEVGNRMLGAKANYRIVPIDYVVKTGDIIEILTGKEGSVGPSRDWLMIVKTSEARTKIRQWFKREKRDENIALGKIEFEKECKRNGIDLKEPDLTRMMEPILKKKNIPNMENFYASISYGGTVLWKLLPRMKEEYLKIAAERDSQNTDKTDKDNVVVPFTDEEQTPVSSKSGVIIDDMDDVDIKLAKCCTPLPGDEIIAFITKGHGISVHTRSCKNVPENIELCDDPNRWVKARWANTINTYFRTDIEVSAYDRTGLVADLSGQLGNMKIHIHNMSSRSFGDGKAIVRFNITVRDKSHLRDILSRLGGVNGVISVERMGVNVGITNA